MKACVHVIKKDTGGLLDLLEGLLALLWEVRMGREHVRQQEVCVRTGLGLSPPCVFFSWQKHRTLPVSVKMPSVLHSLLGCYRVAQELI